MSDPEPGIADIRAAAERLSGVAVETPLLSCPELDRRTGARVLIKPEVLQRTGSFKFRGAYAKLTRLEPDARARGVVAFSSGNHAQGVAAAAQLLGSPATIVMPADAPAMKIANTEAYGAQVRTYDRYFESREAIGQQIAEETGATLVRPYDDPDVIAGQGTCGLEIARQAAARGLRPEIVLICCGGGGLTAGSALALREQVPEAAVYPVEPAGFDDTRRSLEAGRLVENAPGARSICDALLAPSPGTRTFPLLQRLTAGGLTVTDAEAQAAMAFAYAWLKLVVEPGGAVALAALLAGRLPVQDRTVAVVLTGGNVDPARFCAALSAGAGAQP